MNANTSHRSDPLHHDPDNTIDRALSALRDAAPRPGLEGRILASLEHRAIAPQPARFHLSAHIALWTATAATVLAITSLAILHHHRAAGQFAHAPQLTSTRPTKAVILSEAPEGAAGESNGAQSKDPDTARLTTNSELFPATSLDRTAHTVSSRPELPSRHPERNVAQRRTPVFENCSDRLPTGCPTLDAQRQGGVAQASPTDAQLLADLHAPSHPAPPLPLTSQEKLFLHMLRYGNLTELAELSPIVRAKKDADETAAFKVFFPDPPPLDQPGDTE
jgi:hypothetical protein